MAPAMDTRPVCCELFDLNDRRVGELWLEPRTQGQPLREIVWHGRRFREGDGTGFYGVNQFAELPAEAAS
jgi:hypothetical protein